MPDETLEASARTSDCVLALVSATRAQVHELLRREGLDFLDRPHFEEGSEGVGELLLLLSFAQVEDLRAESYEVRVLSNQSARWRERRAEIGRRDPFAGSRVVRGIGRKVGGHQPPQRSPHAPRSDQEPHADA
jgi:hypothetical protein